MASLMSPKAAAERRWFVDYRDGDTWQLALIQKQQEEALISLIENGQIKAEVKSFDSIEVAPAGFHTTLKYESILQLLGDEVKPEDVALMTVQLTPERLQENDQLELYQLANATLPTLLGKLVKLAVQKQGIDQAPDLFSAALSFLLVVVPKLPVDRTKGQLDWLWPGALEITQGMMKFGSLMPQISSITEQIPHLLSVLSEKISTLSPTTFRYEDLASYFLIQKLYFPTFSAHLKLAFLQSAQVALSLNTELSPELEATVTSSIEAILEVIKEEKVMELVHLWAGFLARFRFTKWTVGMIKMMTNALSVDKSLAAIWKAENTFKSIVSSATRSEKVPLMDLIQSAGSIDLISELFPSDDSQLPQLGQELRNDYLLLVLEKKQWSVVEMLTMQGRTAASCVDDRGHFFLLTLALGRSMPWELVVRFFGQRDLENCMIFQMIASRYPEVEQIRLLMHLTSRESVKALLSKPHVQASTSFNIPDVKSLLKTVLFRDRLVFLWLKSKLKWIEKVPLGVVRSLALEYLA